MDELKAANFGARAGERIVGNLGRGGDGKFTSAGDGESKPTSTPDRSKLRQAIGLDAKPKKGKAGGKGKGAKPKPTDEEKAAEKQAKQDANRAKVAPALGVSDDDSKSLAALAAGGEPGNTDDLVKRGLVELGGDGAPRLTTSGNALNTAMNRGDVGAAKRVMSVAQDRKAKKDQREAEKAERERKKAEKQAEKDRKAGKQPATPAPATTSQDGSTAQDAATTTALQETIMTTLAKAFEAILGAWIDRLRAAKAISAERADALDDTAALFAGHLTGIDEELVVDALKAGRRNSSSDAAMLQTVHDMSVKLGADCAPAEKPTLKSLPAGMSYDQAREEIRQAIKEKYTPEHDTVIATAGEIVAVDREYYCWVVELYEDTAIYEGSDHNEMYRVSYAFTSDGLLLGEPVKVKRVTQYVPVVDGFKSYSTEGGQTYEWHRSDGATKRQGWIEWYDPSTGEQTVKYFDMGPWNSIAQYESAKVHVVEQVLSDGTKSRIYLGGPIIPTEDHDGIAANPYAVKSLGNDRIGGYAVLFGDSSATDLTGDYFTKSTDFWLNEIGPNRPMLYHHALETATKSDPVVGIWDTLRVDDLGVWAEGQLKRAHRYKKAVKQLVDAGALGLSSGSAPNLVLKSKKLGGATEIKRWPILEVSLTPEPAEPRMTPVTAIKSYFADAGLDLPAALDDAPDTPPSTEGAQVQTDAQSVADRARRLNVELDLLTL